MKYLFQWANIRSSILILIMISGLSFIGLFSSVTAQDDGGDVVPDAPSSEHISILAWSPEGKMIAVGMNVDTCNNPLNNYSIRLLDAETLQPIRQLGDNHHCSVTNLDWSPNSRYLVASYAGEGADVWDTSTGKPVGQMPFSAVGSNENKWSPDGKKIAGRDGSVVLVWDLSSGHISEAFEYHEALVTQIAWSPDGQVVASSGEDGKLLINIDSENVIEFLHSQAPIDALAWSPDGKRLAYAGQETGDKVQIIPFMPPLVPTAIPSSATTRPYVEDEVYSIKWSPDGRWIAVSGGERTCNYPATDSTSVRIFDAKTRQLTKKLAGMNCTSTSLDWSPDSQHLVAVNIVQDFADIWDVDKEQLTMTFPINMQGVGRTTWNPTQNIIAISSPTNFIAFYDPTTGRRLSDTLSASGSIGEWSPNGTSIVGGSFESGKLYIQDIASSKTTMTLPSAAETGTYNITWSPDGSKIAASNTAGSVQIWNAVTGEALITWPVPEVIDVRFSPNGRKLATTSLNGKVQVWRVDTGELLDTFINHDKTYSVTWSPDGSQIAYFDKNTSTLHIVEPTFEASLIALTPS